jgi:hypothetical protein
VAVVAMAGRVRHSAIYGGSAARARRTLPHGYLYVGERQTLALARRPSEWYVRPTKGGPTSARVRPGVTRLASGSAY